METAWGFRFMKLIIAGSRDIDDIQHLYNAILTLDLGDFVRNEVTEIVSGGARGADYLGEVLAAKLDKKLTKMPAEWDKYGKKAGFMRNEDMAKYCVSNGRCLLLWDGKSNGTKNMLDNCVKYKIPRWIYYLKNDSSHTDDNRRRSG